MKPEMPAALRDHLEQLMRRAFSYVCLGVDRDGRLAGRFGDPASLGIQLPARGESVQAALPFLVGLDLHTAQTIPDINLRDDRSVDLHVLPGDPAWLILADSSATMRARRDLQQAANETRLINAQQRRLMDELIDSRAELALRKQEAEESNRQKSEFIAGMAHEFRTPLTSVLGYAQLLQDHAGSDPASTSYLMAVERAARHLLALVENNLDQARLESGSLVIHRVDAQVRQMVDDIAAIVAPLAAEKGLTFGAYVAHAVPATLWLDDVRLRQIIVNLLSNAVKFTDEGEVQLQLDWQDGVLSCTVSDTGPGIPEEARARIFEAFERLEKTELKPGAGLGLNISMRLARLMGGEIVLRSTQGRGSEFTLRLTARTGRSEPRDADFSGLGAQLDRQTAAAVRLLVAEDNPDIMRLLEAFLVPAGYHLIKTGNGMEAVEMALAQMPPLVILDLNMPGLDGMQAARRLRKSGFRGRLLALTATRGAEHRRAALDAGFDDYLSKPIQMPQLLGTLERLLAQG